MTGRLLSVLVRLSPPARRMGVVAMALVALSIVASALMPGSELRHRTHGASAGTRGSSSATTSGAPRHLAPVPVAELARARVVAGRFLESYLPFLYGRPLRSR